MKHAEVVAEILSESKGRQYSVTRFIDNGKGLIIETAVQTHREVVTQYKNCAAPALGIDTMLNNLHLGAVMIVTPHQHCGDDGKNAQLTHVDQDDCGQIQLLSLPSMGLPYVAGAPEYLMLMVNAVVIRVK